MVPGYLHFDVRRGLRADMINGAMASLESNLGPIRKAFDDLGFGEISFSVSEHSANGIKGKLIQFHIGENFILRPSSSEIMNLSNRSSRFSHNIPASLKTDAHKFNFAHNKFLHACFYDETVILDDIAKVFLNKSVKPAIAALSIKILEKLKSPIFVEQKLDGVDALWLFCHLVALVAQIDALDPKFITATKICVGEKSTPHSSTKNLSLDDDFWLKQVFFDLSVIEVENIVETDVLGAAFLKVLASHLGVRGESTIKQVGVGLSTSMKKTAENGMVEALWCEAKMPSSQNECGSIHRERVVHLYEIAGLVAATSEISHLSSMLMMHGALSPSFHLVSAEKNQAFYHMRFYCDDIDKNSVIEAFLIKGNANSVVVRNVERHELHKRLVSVPIGTGNKISSMRFHEYLYLGKTVRVEPIKEDLDEYVEKTDYSVDVARGDLLMAWKKWRGRMVAEDT